MTLREQAAAAKTDKAALKLVVDALRATKDPGMAELADDLTARVRTWDVENDPDDTGCETPRVLILVSADELAEFLRLA